jgi:hypothetical protein
MIEARAIHQALEGLGFNLKRGGEGRSWVERSVGAHVRQCIYPSRGYVEGETVFALLVEMDDEFGKILADVRENTEHACASIDMAIVLLARSGLCPEGASGLRGWSDAERPRALEQLREVGLRWLDKSVQPPELEKLIRGDPDNDVKIQRPLLNRLFKKSESRPPPTMSARDHYRLATLCLSEARFQEAHASLKVYAEKMGHLGANSPGQRFWTLALDIVARRVT